MPKIRVAVVDESALLRGLLAQAVNRQPDMVCVGSARDALAARELLRAGADVLTLDAGMSGLDGLEFLSRVLRLKPVPFIMVAPPAERGAEIARKALELGALDVVRRQPGSGTAAARWLADEIVATIRRTAKAQLRPTLTEATITTIPPAPVRAAPLTARARSTATAIG